VVSDTSLLLAVTRSGFGTSALLAKATFCSAGVASNFHATEIADTSKEKILRAYLRRWKGRSGGSSRASTPMPCAAESLRTTPPDLYAQILMTAEGEAAEAARKDPDAFVALFLSYADEQEVIAGFDVPTKRLSRPSAHQARHHAMTICPRRMRPAWRRRRRGGEGHGGIWCSCS
jgi:hypothetical protein